MDGFSTNEILSLGLTSVVLWEMGVCPLRDCWQLLQREIKLGY